jgi:phosphoribosylaminoimidazole (AIR) synthetase
MAKRALVHCRICKAAIDRDNQTDWIEPTPKWFYHKPCYEDFARKKGKIKDCANITAGGIYANLNRILPKGLKANLNLKHIPNQPIYQKLYEICGDEIFDVFNAGIGFCMVAERACNEIFFEDCQKYNPIILGVIE